MNRIKRNIPNLITLANLNCGLFAIIFAFQGSLTTASLCIFLGAFLDFLDGLAARILKVSSEFGKQLDAKQLKPRTYSVQIFVTFLFRPPVVNNRPKNKSNKNVRRAASGRPADRSQ